ncbi:MAG: RsmB/NOP family class I SAM-dependent RNA methyltransferase [Pseudomonadota bacterium]
MTPAARVAAAIEVLEIWRDGTDGLDRVLAAWGRAHRFAGSGDRHAIADLAYATLRRARSLQWRGGAGDPGSALESFEPRRAVLALSVLQGQSPDAFAGQGRHAPAPLLEEEYHDLNKLKKESNPSLEGVSPGLAVDLPDWVADHLVHLSREALFALGERAPLDLRVNTLKTSIEEASAALAEDGVLAQPGPLAPTCLRVDEAARRVAGSRAYREGLVEIQDAASQAVAAYAGADPGETVLDLCAGGGGKTLALAAAMGGPRHGGRLLAYDIAPGRMRDLRPRAARAGAAVEILATADLSSLPEACDLILADAPCSGSGAWRRNPDASWRFTPDDLAQLEATQDRILDQAARLLRPGGRLVYATCSILPAENEARIEAFLARTRGFVETGPRFVSLPNPAGGDGFFASMMQKSQ